LGNSYGVYAILIAPSPPDKNLGVIDRVTPMAFLIGALVFVLEA
jgi:hypothetical protein